MSTTSTTLMVMNRDQAESWRTHVQHVMISIIDPGSTTPTLPAQASRIGWLVRAFTDFDRAHRGVKRMTKDDAKVIAEFALDHYGQVPLMVIHCEAGISRSPAIAAAIAKFETGNDDDWFRRYLPNRWVYRQMADALCRTTGKMRVTIQDHHGKLIGRMNLYASQAKHLKSIKRFPIRFQYAATR